jgi:pyruvate carboxylase
MERIVHGMNYKEALQILRQADGYYLTNTARDLSQSDFKNRILLHTDLLAAEARENANYFSLEITGGASVHVDILRKQVDPFLKLELFTGHTRRMLSGLPYGNLQNMLMSGEFLTS